MIWHFTVDGVGACAAAETCDPRLDPCTSCSYRDLTACERDAERVRALYPEADVRVHEGSCSEPRGEELR